MKNVLSAELKSLIDIPPYLPSVSVILPFEPKMSAKHELQQLLHNTYHEVKQELSKVYPEEVTEAVLKRFSNLITTLDYTTYKKSICIFVSPIVEKVIYLALQVRKKISIDESFKIREVLRNKKEFQQFLLLVLSGNNCRLYTVDDTGLLALICKLPVNMKEVENDAPERVSNFSDPSARKETTLNKLLHHVDNSLSLILEEYPLPLLVSGTHRMLGHFKAISHHQKHVSAYIAGNYAESLESDLGSLVKPFVDDWKKYREQDLLSRLDKALGAGKLVTGVQEVYSASSRSNSRLLVVEQDFLFPADKIDGHRIQSHDGMKEIYMQDAVDTIIENVLRSGGDVAFVSSGLLQSYDHIALIKYYLRQ